MGVNLTILSPPLFLGCYSSHPTPHSAPIKGVVNQDLVSVGAGLTMIIDLMFPDNRCE